MAEWPAPSPSAGRRRATLTFALVVCAYVLYSALLVSRSSIDVAGERFFLLDDDPMVSMQYAKNLAHGHGAVWNAGEARVEGFSNPAWMCVMAAVHLLPVPESRTSLVVEAIALTLLVSVLFLVRRLTRAAGGTDSAAIAAAALTAFFVPLNGWALFGSEIALLLPGLVLAVTVALEHQARGRFSVRPYWILGALTLVRIDAAVLAAGAAVGLAWIDRDRWRRHVLAAGAIGALFLGLQTVVRLWYYGEWLPNPYFLKLTGYPIAWRVEWGLRGLASFVVRRHLWLFVLPVAIVFARHAAFRVLATVVAAEVTYQVYTGIRDTRFLTLVMPLGFVMLAIALRDGIDRVAGVRSRATVAITTRPGLSLTALTFASLSLTNAVTPWWSSVPPTDARVITRLRLVDAITTPDARVAVALAGTNHYVLDRSAIDLLGKNDAVIARGPVNALFTRDEPFVSGHMKWDYAYSIGRLAPDIVTELWRAPEQAAPFLAAYRAVDLAGARVFLRRDSARIRWDRVGDLEAQGALANTSAR
jgi:hypothetical protein